MEPHSKWQTGELLHHRGWFSLILALKWNNSNAFGVQHIWATACHKTLSCHLPSRSEKAPQGCVVRMFRWTVAVRRHRWFHSVLVLQLRLQPVPSDTWAPGEQDDHQSSQGTVIKSLGGRADRTHGQQEDPFELYHVLWTFSRVWTDGFLFH